MKTLLREKLPYMTACELLNCIQTKEIAVQELIEFFLHRLRHANHSLHAFLYINEQDAIEQAKKADALLQEKGFCLPLLGLPVVVPDVLNMKGVPTTFGSLLLAETPSKDDAIEISLIKQAGAIILGKTNTAEFGLFPETVNRLSPPSCNPLNPLFSPGGPNGGSGVAVAARLAPIAIGTDICGSLRMTSSFCGLEGLIPTRGRFPTVRDYLMPFSERMFYRKGIIAHASEDIALLLNILDAEDTRNPSVTAHPHMDFRKELEQPVGRLKIGWFSQLGGIPADPEVIHAIEQAMHFMEEQGHQVEMIDPGIDQDLFPHFLDILASDRYVMIMEMLEHVPHGIDLVADYTKEWLRIGDHVTGAQYSIAETYMEWVQETMAELFKKFDLIASPTIPAAPFPIGNPPQAINGIPLNPQLGMWPFTCLHNICGNPAITIPWGMSGDKLPIGIQFAAHYWEEKILLQVAREMETGARRQMVKS